MRIGAPTINPPVDLIGTQVRLPPEDPESEVMIVLGGEISMETVTALTSLRGRCPIRTASAGYEPTVEPLHHTCSAMPAVS